MIFMILECFRKYKRIFCLLDNYYQLRQVPYFSVEMTINVFNLGFIWSYFDSVFMIKKNGNRVVCRD